MAKIVIAGDAGVVTSAMKLEDIKFLKERGQKPVFQNKSGHDFCA